MVVGEKRANRLQVGVDEQGTKEDLAKANTMHCLLPLQVNTAKISGIWARPGSHSLGSFSFYNIHSSSAGIQ